MRDLYKGMYRRTLAFLELLTGAKQVDRYRFTLMIISNSVSCSSHHNEYSRHLKISYSHVGIVGGGAACDQVTVFITPPKALTTLLASLLLFWPDTSNYTVNQIRSCSYLTFKSFCLKKALIWWLDGHPSGSSEERDLLQPHPPPLEETEKLA